MKSLVGTRDIFVTTYYLLEYHQAKTVYKLAHLSSKLIHPRKIGEFEICL